MVKTKSRRTSALILIPILATCVLAICSLVACADDTDRVVPKVQIYDIISPTDDTLPMGERDGSGAAKDGEGSSLAEDGYIRETPQKDTREELSPEGARGEAQSEIPDIMSGNGHRVNTLDELRDLANKDKNIITITISAAGDCSLGNHHEQDYSSSFRQAYDKAGDDGYFFENVLDIFQDDDMTIVNLEGVLTLSEERLEDRTYSIKGDPAYAGILAAGSVETVSMGNNHRFDYGEAGSNDTVAALKKEGIVYAYDYNIGIYETKGIRIGIVSVNETSMASAVEKIMESGISRLKEAEVNLILACCHWGIEREYYPEEYQTSLGRKCIDWGADLVLGHHPHVLQGIDKYKGKYIVYSLANFCFGANRNPEDKDTMIFRQSFTFRDGIKEESETVRIIPCSVSSVRNRNDFKPTPAKGEEGERIINRINEYSAGFGVGFDKEGWVIK